MFMIILYKNKLKELDDNKFKMPLIIKKQNKIIVFNKPKVISFGLFYIMYASLKNSDKKSKCGFENIFDKIYICKNKMKNQQTKVEKLLIL